LPFGNHHASRRRRSGWTTASLAPLRGAIARRVIWSRFRSPAASSTRVGTARAITRRAPRLTASIGMWSQYLDVAKFFTRKAGADLAEQKLAQPFNGPYFQIPAERGRDQACLAGFARTWRSWLVERWREELESDVVGVSERDVRAIGVLLDLAMRNAQFVEPRSPGFEAGTVAACKR